MPPTGALALRGSVFARNRRRSGTQTLRDGARSDRAAARERFLIAAPQHRHRRGQTAAHVEGEITFCVWNLPLSGLFGQMLIRFNNLPHAGRSDRMAVAD